jgi:hypothetical protein
MVVAEVDVRSSHDVGLGLGYDDIAGAERDQVLSALPRVDFKQQIIRAFGAGIAHKPHTAFGNVKADVLERTLPGYRRPNFCDAVLASPFADD